MGELDDTLVALEQALADVVAPLLGHVRPGASTDDVRAAVVAGNLLPVDGSRLIGGAAPAGPRRGESRA